MDTEFYEIRTIINACVIILFHLPYLLYFISRNNKYRVILIVSLSIFYSVILIKNIITYTNASVVWESRIVEFVIFDSWLIILIAFLIIDHLKIANIFSKVILVVYFLLGLHLIDMINLNSEILNTGLVYDQAAGKFIEPEGGVPSFSNRVYLDNEKELVINCAFDFGTKYIYDSQLSITFYFFKYTTNVKNLTINFTPTPDRWHKLGDLLG